MSVTMEKLLAEGWPGRLITLDQWRSLPEEDELLLECQEGVVQVAPRTDPRHQFAAARLMQQLLPQLPPGLIAVPDCDVLLVEEPLTVRAPDLVVVPDAALQGGYHIVASEVCLAVEVLSPGSRRIDRVLRANEYAEVGIPSYWIVDLDEPSIHVLHRRVDDRYELVTTIRDAGVIEACGVTVSIDLAPLLSS